MRFRITVAYDGTDFVGWQRQASGRSIQGLLEEALRDLDGRDVTVTGAGRTDAGVHALGQVAAFALERTIAPASLVGALNARLPDTVRVLDAAEADAAFHARFGVRAKRYRYRIWHADLPNPFERRYAWHIAGHLDLDAMRTAARCLVGRHDFAAFRAAGSEVATTVRDVTSSRIATAADASDLGVVGVLCGEGRLVVYEIVGNGFLRHMVRNIVGSLVEVGRGRRDAAWMREVLASRDRALAGPTAPPEGLFLVDVAYLAAER